MKAARRILIAALVAASLVPASARAQIVYGDRYSGKLRFIATSWTANDPDRSRLTQTLVPFFGYLPLGENFEGRIYLARVWNSLSAPGGGGDLTGMVDSRLQVNRSFAEDRLLASVGLSLPTGRTGLSLDDDLPAMEFLARDYLIFPNRRLGEGLALNALVGTARTLGEYRLGGSVSLHHSASYEAYAGQGDYDPGDYLRIYGGARRQYGRMNLTLGAALSVHADDTLAGREIYNRGPQWELHAGGQYRRPGLAGGIDLRAFLRGRSRIFDLEQAQSDQVQLYGNEVAASTRLSWILRGGTLEIGPLADLRLIGGNELGRGRSWNLGGGAQSFLHLGGGLRVGLSWEVFTGKADAGGIELSGYQVATSLGGSL